MHMQTKAAKAEFTQTGVRQRSLRKHCRIGRATELVFILATGATMVLGGAAQADTIRLKAGETVWNFGIAVGDEDKWSRVPSNQDTDFANGDDVIFNDMQTVTIGVDVQPTSLTFDVSGVEIAEGAGTIAFGTNALSFTVTNAGETATVSAGMTGTGDITVDGADATSVLVLSGDNSGVTGDLGIDSGTVTLQGNYGAGGTGGIDVASGAGLNAESGTISGAVTSEGAVVAGGATFDGGLTVQGAGASLDLTANTTGDIVNGGAGGSGITFEIDNMLTVTGDVSIADSAGIINHNGTIAGALGVGDGQVIASDTSTVRGAVTVDAGTLTSNGATFEDIGGVTQTVTVNSGTFAVNDTVAGQTTANASVDAGALTIAANEELTGDVDLIDSGAGASGGTVLNDGTIGGDVSVADGTFTNSGTGAITGATTVTGGALNAAGAFTGGLVVSGGTIDFTGATTGEVTNAGVTGLAVDQILTGDFNQQSGTTDLTGTIDGALAASGGTLTNNGIITGQTTISGTGIVVANGGTFETDNAANPDVSLTGGRLRVSAATTAEVNNAGGVVEVQDNVALSGAIVSSSGSQTLADGSSVSGGITLTGTAGLAVTGDVTTDIFKDSTSNLSLTGGHTITGNLTVNDGTLSFGNTVIGDVAVTGGLLSNANAGKIQDDVVVVSGGKLSANGGTFRNAADTADASIDVSGTGILDIDADTTLTTVTNSGGTVIVDQDLTADVTNTSGTLSNLGTIIGQVTNAGDVNARGTFTQEILNNGGTVTVVQDSSADVNNNGGDLVVNTGQTLTGNVNNQHADSSISIVGSGEIDGTVDLSAGELTTSGTITGTVTQTGGTIAANGATFDQTVLNNAGTMTVTGNTTGDVNSDGGDLTIASGRLTGDVDVLDAGSTLTNNGILDGTVDLTAGILDANGGDVTGAVTNNGGTINANGGDLSGGVTNTAGTVNINADTSGDIANGDTLAINGELTGNVTNSGAGTTVNNDTIDGTLTITGGTVDQNAGSDTTGLTTLSNGTLDANGGSFSGGIRTTGGTLNLNADTAADIENDGSVITLPAGTILTGDFTNTDGTAALDGVLNGDVTVDNGTVTTAITSSVSGDVTVNNGTLTAGGGSIDGNLTANAGTVDVNADLSVGGTLVNNGAAVTVDAAATLTGDVNQTSGTTTLLGDVTGDVTASGGTMTQDGIVTGDVDLSGGSITTSATSSIGGATSVTGGTLAAAGGTFTGGITNNGGSIDVTGAITGDVNNRAGSVTLDSAAVVTGNMANAGTLTSTDGAVTGALTNTGTVDVTGGDLSVGSFTNSGTITVAGGNTLSAATTGTVSNGGTLSITGSTVAADVTAARGSTLNLSSATIDGDLSVGTDTTINNGLDVTGAMALTSAADMVLASGDLEIGSTFDLDRNTTFELTTGTTLTATETTNAGTFTARDITAIDGAFTNTGTLNITNLSAGSGPLVLNAPATPPAGTTFNGQVTNSGTINGTGTLTFAGGLDNNDGVLDLTGNGATTDNVIIGGTGLTGDGTLRFDIDLAAGGATADLVTMSPGAFVTGEVSLDFNVLGEVDAQGLSLVLVDIADNDPGNFTIAPNEIVDPRGILSYSVELGEDGNIVIEDGLNSGLSGLAGNIVLTQSLIGSIVNRPTSPFVTGLAFEDEDPCGYGGWSRATGGYADATGSVTQEGRAAITGTVTATYGGIQVGGDYACFNGAVNGWDLAVGGIMGVNTGSTTQPVFALDQTTQISTTNVDFNQLYAGAYATAVNGPIAVDLQYRLETTDFSASNSTLGLNGSEFSSDASTISGAASYFYSIPDTDFSIVPTAGFAYTQVKTGPINFENLGDLDVEDFDSKVLFAGGTIARSTFGDDGVSATRQFVSATVYTDLASDPTSIFSPADGSPDVTLSSQNLGTYGEISGGINMVRILQPNELGNVKQISASVRADARYGDQLESYGVTGQVRFQF